MGPSKVLVLSAAGQVGRALLERLGEKGVGLPRSEADLGRPDSLAQALERFSPRAVINAAAYTQVDKAEEEEAQAERINGESPAVLAQWCFRRSIPFIHYSTDYVFSGEGSRPWAEEDSTGPLNAYGRTKLSGEKAIAGANGKWIVFRTSWVYDSQGQNFVKTMLRFGAEKDELRIVSDQWGAPTYAPHLAEATLQALEKAGGFKDFPSGLYHLCNSGETNWHGFALEIFRWARENGLPLRVSKVSPVTTAEYPRPAARPLNSRLATEKVKRVFGIQMPPWPAGLEKCMERLSDASHPTRH